MLDLVGVIARDLRTERPFDVLRRCVRLDLEEDVVVLQGHLFLNSATLAGGSSRRVSPSSRPRSRRRFGPRGRTSVVVLRAQYGQKFQPGCIARPQCGHPPPTRLPHWGHALKSTPTAEPQPVQSVRISRTSVTTRSSSSGVVMPLFPCAGPSSPSVIIPPLTAASRS